MKNILFIMLLIGICATELSAQLAQAQLFDVFYSAEGKSLIYDAGSEVASGSEVVAQRIAQEVFEGTGKFMAGEVGPNPNTYKYVENEDRDAKKLNWVFKPLASPKGAVIIEQAGHKLVLTKRLDGRLLLKPYKKGDKTQLFRLERDTVKFLYCLYIKDYESGLVATDKEGKLLLETQRADDKTQLWHNTTEPYYDMVYNLQKPTARLALTIGDQMEKLKKAEKAQVYYERAYQLSPQNAQVCYGLGYRYVKYDKAKAESFYERAFSLKNDDANFCGKVGLGMLKLNLAKGLQYCRKANELKKGTVDFGKLTTFHNGMAPVYLNRKYGVINTKGELLTEELFDGAYQSLDNIMIALYKDSKWRYINNKGNFVGEWYLFLKDFDKGVAAVATSKETWGVIDSVGNEIVPCEYKKISMVNHMIVVQNAQDQFKVLSYTGKPIVDQWFKGAVSYEKGTMVGVKGDDDKWRFLKNNGAYVNGSFKNIKLFTKGVAFVQNAQGKWGAIDMQGNEVLAYQYHHVKGVCNGLAAITNEKGEYAIVNNQGKMITDDWYDNAWAVYNNSKVAVKKRKNWFYIDENGKKLGGKYESIGVFSEGFAFAKKSKGWIVIDEKGKTVIRDAYDNYKSAFSHGRAKVEKDGKIFFINPQGEKIARKLLEN